MSIKKSKERVRSEQQILHLLVNIIDLYPQYSVSQHLTHILRKKGETKDSYDWDEVLLLKKIEDYYDELRNDLDNDIEED